MIEIDGRYHNHDEQNQKDMERDNELQSHGLTIIRFSEMEIRTDMMNVLRTLEDHYLEHTARDNDDKEQA